MKNYHEMAQSVLSRINEYETAKKRKKKVVLKTAVPACCLCAAVLAGVCLHGTGAKSTKIGIDDTGAKKPISALQNSTAESRKNVTPKDEKPDSSSATKGKKLAYINDDMLGLVIVDGKEYIQEFTDYVIGKTYTADQFIGDARDFEGTYKSGDSSIPAKLYTTKESRNVFLVKLSNGGTVVLIRNGELCVNNKDYVYSSDDLDGATKEKCIGKARPYIIEVPTVQNNIGADDTLWTVQGDENKLIAVKPDGTQALYCVEKKN